MIITCPFYCLTIEWKEKLTFQEAGKLGKAHLRLSQLLNSAQLSRLNSIFHWLMEPQKLGYVQLQHL